MSNLDGVEDLQVTQSFEVFMSHRGDLGAVTGREAFEQEVALRLQDRYVDVIGELEPEAIREVLKNAARRVAQEMNQLENVANFRAQEAEAKENTFEVTIIFNTGDVLNFEVN